MLDIILDLLKGLGGLGFLWILTGGLLVVLYVVLDALFDLK